MGVAHPLRYSVRTRWSTHRPEFDAADIGDTGEGGERDAFDRWFYEQRKYPIGALPEGADVSEMAAWTVVSNVLLNLDGVLTKG